MQNYVDDGHYVYDYELMMIIDHTEDPGDIPDEETLVLVTEEPSLSTEIDEKADTEFSVDMNIPEYLGM